jgi:hypothetical protein
MQLLTKEIEENARWKEETRERFENEQKELKVQQRLISISKFATEITRSEIENMSDETFTVFLSGIEKAYNDRIEAEKKAESERIAKEQAEKEEQERVRKENERLKKEAEEKEKQLEAERAKAESERKAIEEKARKEREESERKIKAEQEIARIAAEKAKAEKEKLEAEIRAKNEAEEKARKEAELKSIADQKAKETAEKKAKNAPDKVKLLEVARNIDNIVFPEIKGEEAMRILSDVKTLLAKVSVFIKDKSELL